MSDHNSKRPCACHPDDSPPKPCAGRFALSECSAGDDYAASVALIPQPGEPDAWRYKDTWGRWAYCQAVDNSVGPGVITEKQALYTHPPTGDVTQLTADVEALTSALERQSDYVKRVVAERDLLVKAFMPHITVAQRAALEAALSTSPDPPSPR